MRNPPYDPAARKRTVSLTLNADLYAKAKGAGINLSKVAEAALAQALAQHLAEQARAEIRQDLAALSAFVEAHGSSWSESTTRRSRAMRRFDVLDNPIPRARRALPFVTILQSDLAELAPTGSLRRLPRRPQMPPLAGRLIPIVKVDDQDYAVLVPALTALRATDFAAGSRQRRG